MGYTTFFTGAIKFNVPVNENLKNYINSFSKVRHMKRDPEVIKVLDSNWKEHCFGEELGEEGEYYIVPEEIGGMLGQNKDESVIDLNEPSSNCPSLWCKWIINDNNEIVWNGKEKFYYYVEWLQYIIDNFITPIECYSLNGVIHYQGEDFSDRGVIWVVDNEITVLSEVEYAAITQTSINENIKIIEITNGNNITYYEGTCEDFFSKLLTNLDFNSAEVDRYSVNNHTGVLTICISEEDDVM